MNGNNAKWRFQAPGERGDAVTSNLYRVVNYGNGEKPNTYTYFSLANGRKLLTNRASELSNSELESLDASVAKQGQKGDQNEVDPWRETRS